MRQVRGRKTQRVVSSGHKPRCPECASSQTLYGKRKKLFWCRVCGTEFDKSGKVVGEVKLFK